MPSTKDAINRPTRASAKEDRARSAALFNQEHEAEKRAVAAKTARLRALRLAMEQSSTPAPKAKTPRKKDR